MRIDRPERLTRLDWQRFSRFFVVGDLRRPQTLAPGLTPAQTRARGQDLMDSISAPAGLHAAAPPFHVMERIRVQSFQIRAMSRSHGFWRGHPLTKIETTVAPRQVAPG